MRLRKTENLGIEGTQLSHRLPQTERVRISIVSPTFHSVFMPGQTLAQRFQLAQSSHQPSFDQKRRHDPASLAITAKNIQPLTMKTLGLEAIGQTRQTGQRSRPTNRWQATIWSGGLGVPHSGILDPSNHIFVAPES